MNWWAVPCTLIGMLVSSYAVADGPGPEVWQSVRISTGVDFSTGSYGEDQGTDILYFPVTASLERGPLRADITVPYLHVSGPAFVVDGAVLSDSTTRPDGVKSAEGLGDVRVKLSYAFEQFWDDGVFIDIAGALKIPTASFAKGLGTNKADLSLTLDGAINVGDWLPFAQAGYKITGSPDSFKVRNIWLGSVGAQYTLSERLSVGASLDARQSAVRERGDSLESMAYVNTRLTSNVSVNVYGVAGLSENAPDAGIGLQVIWRSR